MKNFTITSVFILVAAMANANDFSENVSTAHGNFLDEPISFVERGISFFVFSNGEFDFDTQQSATGTYFYKGPRQNQNFSNQQFGTLIEQDQFGRVRRVGNVFINYDASSRIRRIGTVYMNYNNFGLAQVGNLQLIYDRRGNLVDFVGNVKGFRAGHNYNYSPTVYHYNNAFQGGNQNYNDSYFYKNEKDSTQIPRKIEKVERR